MIYIENNVIGSWRQYASKTPNIYIVTNIFASYLRGVCIGIYYCEGNEK